MTTQTQEKQNPIKLYFLSNGAQIAGEVIKETKTYTTLNNPLIVIFGDDGLRMVTMLEPGLTHARQAVFQNKEFIIDGVEIRDEVKDIYYKYVDGIKDYEFTTEETK